MIGLVYTDYFDPSLNDSFHQAACETFQNIARQYPDDVLVLTDPDVTSARLWALFEECEFLFYWGHGKNHAENGAIITGSNDTESISIKEIGQKLHCKYFFLDACSIANGLDDKDFTEILLVGPTDSPDYDTSVRVGCRLIGNLLGSQLDFKNAFYLTIAELDRSRIYRLVGGGAAGKISLREATRECVVNSFDFLLNAWKKYHQTGNEVSV